MRGENASRGAVQTTAVDWELAVPDAWRRLDGASNA